MVDLMLQSPISLRHSYVLCRPGWIVGGVVKDVKDPYIATQGATHVLVTPLFLMCW